MRLRAEIESGGSGVGRFGGVLCVAVSYLPGDVYSKFCAISPSASRRVSHQISSPEVAFWLEVEAGVLQYKQYLIFEQHVWLTQKKKSWMKLAASASIFSSLLMICSRSWLQCNNLKCHFIMFFLLFFFFFWKLPKIIMSAFSSSSGN